MRKLFKLYILYFAILLLAGCSTKVNKIPNRAFHSTTTKYNILFNGEASFKEGMFKLHDAYVEDYDEILPIYLFPDEDQSKEIFPEMNRAIEKASKAIQRHSMYIKKKERNAYIDDSYWLMGRAHLYKHEFSKALEVFNYMTIAYKKQDMGDRAQIAMAKTNIEMNQQEEAFTILQKMESKKDFSKIAAIEFHTTYANYYIREKNYPLAITELKSAIENTKRKKDKARLTFIMAQLYEIMDNKGMASATYDEVLALKPSFELSFQAKTKKALASDATKSIAEAEIELKKLLRKSPQGSSKSLIYIALAELELKKGNSEQAISYLKTASVHATDDKTKKKIFLKSARHYFENKNYINAQMFFDSALKVMSKKDVQYDQVFGLRNNLTRLANNIQIIAYEDSLQKLALLDEDQRKKKVEQIIEDQKKSKEEAVLPSVPVSKTTTQNSTWYFSNETTRNFGFKEFKKIWGTRVSEDNWRRKVKSMNFTTMEEGMVETLKLSEEDIESATLEKYLENIPDTPEKMAASHNKRANAYYDLGVIYMEQLKEPELAIENFKIIVNEYDTSKHAPASAYFMYTLCKELRDEHCTEQAKNFILSEFPESEYAQVVKNPNYFIEKKKNSEKIFPIYEETYALYKKEDYLSCLGKINEVEAEFANNIIESKFALLKAFCEGKLQGEARFIELLTEVEVNYKNTEEAKEATRILALLKGTKSEEKTSTFNEIQSYSLDPYAEHQYAIVIPINAESELSLIKSKISDFNNMYFPDQRMSISDLLLNQESQMILVKPQKTMKDGVRYHQIFIQEAQNFMMGVEFQSFCISSPNLSILYKNKDVTEYMSFFSLNYVVE